MNKNLLKSPEAAAAQELLQRQAAKKSYQTYIDLTLGLRPANHHKLLIEKLQAVADGYCKRLMVFMPPGSAKSTYANVNFSPWYLGRNENHNIITTSYGQELADKWGRKSRNIVSSEGFRRIFGFGLSEDSTAADRWSTERGGEYLAVGIRGPITGNRADGAIIDDPVKGREEADSETIQEKNRDWYVSDLYPRLKPGAWIILIMTRWHENDLAGWLLEEAKNGGEQWEVLSIPAEAENENDPLGRKPGEMLWPEWFKPEMFLFAKRNSRNWSALYQQRPAPEEGDYFKRDWIRYYDNLPANCTLRFYGASDYAVTANDGDFTEHGVVGLDADDNIYIVDWWRKQAASDEWIEAFCDLVAKWKPLKWAGETGQIEKSVGPFLSKRMIERKTYVWLDNYTSSQNKPTRAQSIRGRMAMGKVYFPKQAPWTELLVRQILTFPAGAHDDAVDVLSLIGRMIDEMHSGTRHKVTNPTDWLRRPTFDEIIALSAQYHPKTQRI